MLGKGDGSQAAEDNRKTKCVYAFELYYICGHNMSNNSPLPHLISPSPYFIHLMLII